MEFNLDNLVNAINSEVNATNNKANGNSNNGNNNNNGYPTVYPYVDGHYKVKLFYNPKGGTIQRKISRHDTGETSKVPCLQASYTEDCPVCAAIKEAETLKGKECGAFKKYGYKTRGIAYAKLLEAPTKIMNEERGIRPGSMVILMYPKTVYDELNKLFADNAKQLENIVNTNNCYTINIERSTQGGGYPTYRASIPLDGMSSVFETEKEYRDTQESLPNILDAVVPEYPTSEIRDKAKGLADTIKAEYLNSNIVADPNNEPVVTAPKIESKPSAEDVLSAVLDEEDIPFEIADIAGTNKSVPDCFGKYCNETKCMACLSEMDCRNKSNL